MQITATGSDYRCVWPGGTGKRCYCGDCFWGMCICQSLPNCIMHSIVCVLQHFLRNAQISRLSTCPHCCIPPSLLTAKTRAAVGQRLPFSEACQGRWGAWSVQSEVLREARCCEHEGQTTSVDVLILEMPVICHGACDCVTSLHFILKIFGHHG